MITIEELISTYEKNSDEELMQIHSQAGHYTPEAAEAVNTVIARRGGIEKLSRERQQRMQLHAEQERIRWETMRLARQKVAVADINKYITSSVFTQEDLRRTIETSLQEFQADNEDRAIKPRTIWGSLLGGFIGGTIGGIVWGLQLVQMHRIFWVLNVGLLVLNYGCIKLFTKQSGKNVLVLVLSFVSVLYAMLLGFLIYSIFGDPAGNHVNNLF
jgi:hypothetical protein